MPEPRHEYRIKAVRCDGWWAVEVPEVPGVFTQCRTMAEVEVMAREAIALLLRVPPHSFDVSVDAPELADDKQLLTALARSSSISPEQSAALLRLMEVTSSRGPMRFDDYERAAQRTAGEAPSTGNDRLVLAALGLAGESGEFADTVKKVLFQDHSLDREHMIEEVGDVLWYIAAAARALDCSMADIADANIRKLQARYPTGWDPERSRNRPHQG